MPEEKGAGVKVEKGPGDFSEKPEVPTFRGDEGTSDAKVGEETKSVQYER